MTLARICPRSGQLYTGTNCTCPKCRARTVADNTRRYAKRIAHGRHTTAWKRTRAKVLKRYDYRCHYRLPGCTGKATTVHRLSVHGTHHDSNLDAYRPACAHCHGTIDAPRATR